MSFNYKPLYEDTDGIKVINPLTDEQKRYIAKCFLNAQYGTMITNYKENSMRKEFIVLHEEELEGSTMIVRKSAIISVSTEKFGADTFCYVRTENCSFRVTESYAEVVKRLFE